MAVPTPPLDNAGGMFVAKVSNGATAHRMRFHTLAFNDDATGSYVVPPAGGDAGVAATFTAMANVIRELYNNLWTITLDAAYHIVAHNPVETFAVTPPAGVVGTLAGAAGSFQEAFVSFNFRTALGGRMRFFLLGTPGWGYNVPIIIVPATASTYADIAKAATATTSGVLAHDGNKPILPCRVTWGVNKRLRRRAGDS